jgi:two-component system alkaline phosphatase synthesis response regulator PhoP
MSKPAILVVEDDSDIQQLVSYNLIRAGLHVSCADSGEEALQILATEPIDAIVLDVMLPGKDGHEICQILRSQKKTQNIPIIMLTARSEDDDIVAGLQHGADDYLTKPFSPKVLLARVKALLRRSANEETSKGEQGKSDDKSITCHGMCIHPGRHEVLVAEQEVQLTLSEFALLVLLAARPGWVFSRQQIIDHIRGYDYSITPRAVDVLIFGLRKKLGDAGDSIETVRGIGYRMR